jgi:hypothetical protein
MESVIARAKSSLFRSGLKSSSGSTTTRAKRFGSAGDLVPSPPRNAQNETATRPAKPEWARRQHPTKTASAWDERRLCNELGRRRGEESGDVAAFFVLDAKRILLAFRPVVIFELLPEPPRLGANDRIDPRVERGGTPVGLEGDRHLLDLAGSAVEGPAYGHFQKVSELAGAGEGAAREHAGERLARFVHADFQVPRTYHEEPAPVRKKGRNLTMGKTVGQINACEQRVVGFRNLLSTNVLARPLTVIARCRHSFATSVDACPE